MDSLISLSCEMIVGVAAVFITVALTPLSGLECSSTPSCLKGKPPDYGEGSCPVRITPASRSCSEMLSIHVWLKTDDLNKSPMIGITNSQLKSTIFLSLKKKNSTRKCKVRGRAQNIRIKCPCGATELEHTNRDFDPPMLQWELVYHVEAEAVSVSYTTASNNCSVSYEVKDRVPVFELEVNPLAKSFNVTLDADDNPAYVRWCYRNGPGCFGIPSSRKDIIPSQSRSAVLHFPFLLPCVCVEVYYQTVDSRRDIKCPFLNSSFVDASDVWLSSTLKPYKSSFEWRSHCAASVFSISASLCWRQNDHLCTSTLEPGLEADVSEFLRYNTSDLDKHPLMCVQFSLQGSHHVECPFEADMSSWEVRLGPGRQSVFLYLTSSIPATFSAQLCVQKERTCVPVGEIHSVVMIGSAKDTKMKVPVYAVAQEPCVQVWRSSPPLIGRRILCPDYAHRRHGLYAVATSMLVFMTAFVVTFLHHLTKSGTTGWLSIQKPALLVCSSEQSAHISAVCALASILQGELSATVHMALWALKSQTRDGTHAGVADLGPLPWLYGQWEAVVKEQGKVLIVWSSEAQKIYEKWKEGRKNANKTEKRHKNLRDSEEEQEKLQKDLVEYSKLNKKRQKGRVHACEEKDSQREPSTVITPVFMAALSCLEGALQRCKGQGVAFVYFQGFCHNRDIPKTFRGIPRYCLPQDFRGLIQELGAKQRPLKTGKFSLHCFPRLLSKIMSVWLARRLAQKLQTLLLHQTQGKKKPRVTSSQQQTLGKTQERLKFPPAEDTGDTGTSQEHEPLRGPPMRGEEISSQVSRV